MSNPQHHRPLAILLAVALPLLVLAAGWQVVRPADGLSSDAVAFNRVLAQREPEVVILGSSLANRGVEVGLLAKTLGVPEGKIVVLQMPHASSAHWYALLKNRVFLNGHRPKLVLVVDALTSMLNHDLLQMPNNIDRLVGQMGAEEPVLASKVFRVQDPSALAAYRARQGRGELRSAWIQSWRDLVVGTLFGKASGKDVDKLVERVNEEVFANDRMDYALHEEDGDDASPFAAGNVPNTENGDYDLERDALLPDLAALAKEYGANLFFVRIPLPPSNAAMDDVPSDIEARAVAWLGELETGYLDMRSLDLDDSYFEDMRHLSRQGSQLFTGSLGRVLVALRAMEPGAGARVIRGMEEPSAVRVEGEAPALPTLPATGCRREVAAPAWARLDADTLEGLGIRWSPLAVLEDGKRLPGRVAGEGCVGAAWIDGGRLIVSPSRPDAVVELRFDPEPADAADPDAPKVRWVAPGTELVYTFADPWSLPDNAFRVFVRGFAAGNATSPVEVVMGEESFPLRNQAGRVSGDGRLTAPRAANWELRVRVPADGPFVMLHHLAIGVAPSTAMVLGRAESLHGMSVRVVGGRVEDTQHKATFAADPPPIPIVPRVRRGAKGTGLFLIEQLGQLADSETMDAQRPNRCTPVHVMEDGVPLPLPHTPCHEVRARGQGRSCFAANGILFASTDGSDPLTNGKVYSLALTPRRICDVYGQKNSAFLRDSWWLYPGDVATWEIPAEETASFRDGANVVEIEIIPHLVVPEVPLVVELLAGDEVKLRQEVSPADTLRRHRSTWVLPEPLPPRAGDLAVRISNPSGKSFALVTQITVSEEYDVFGGSVRGPTLSADAPAREVPATLRREGVADPIPEPKKGSQTPGGSHEAKVFALWPVSDTYLDKIGLPMASPARFFINDAELTRVTDRKALRGGCKSCFYHTGQSIVFNQAGTGKNSVPRVELNPLVPMAAPSGAQVVWVYPGTSTVLSLPEGWQGQSVRVHAEAITFNAQKEKAGEGVVLEVGPFAAPFVKAGPDGRVEAGLDVDGATPAVIRLRSESGSGSWLYALRVRYEDAGGVALVYQGAAPQPREKGAGDEEEVEDDGATDEAPE